MNGNAKFHVTLELNREMMYNYRVSCMLRDVNVQMMYYMYTRFKYDKGQGDDRDRGQGDGRVKSKYYKCRKLNIDCSICYGKMRFSEYYRELICNHIFHKKCIDKWLKITPTCPLCRMSQ